MHMDYSLMLEVIVCFTIFSNPANHSFNKVFLLLSKTTLKSFDSGSYLLSSGVIPLRISLL